jgi:hypothetical protein
MRTCIHQTEGPLRRRRRHLRRLGAEAAPSWLRAARPPDAQAHDGPVGRSPPLTS